MFALRDALATGSIGFSKHFFCLSQGLREMRQQIEDEMRSFAVIVEPSKTPFGKPKKTYSGKSGGRNDDVAIVIQLAIAGVRIFYQNAKYATWRPTDRPADPCETLQSRRYRV